MATRQYEYIYILQGHKDGDSDYHASLFQANVVIVLGIRSETERAFDLGPWPALYVVVSATSW